MFTKLNMHLKEHKDQVKTYLASAWWTDPERRDQGDGEDKWK